MDTTEDSGDIAALADRLRRSDAKDRSLRDAVALLGPIVQSLPITEDLLLDQRSLSAWCVLRDKDPNNFLIYRAAVRQRSGKSVVELLDIALRLHHPESIREIAALEIGDLLTRDFPPMETLLTPWLRRQHLVMVHAKRGVGKTHFALEIAYAVAGGGKFLKWQAEKPRKVLYIDGEMPGALIKEWLGGIAGASPGQAEPPKGHFRIVTPDAQTCALPDLGAADGQAALAPLLADAELIVLDNLSTLMRAGPENEGESWLPMADWALAQRRDGRAVLFVHHSGKSGAQRGSSRREDLLDVVIKLQHPTDYSPDRGAQFLVRFEKSRGLYGAEVRDFEATLTRDESGRQLWTWRDSDGATMDRVVEMIQLEMSDSEIADELGVHRSTVYRARKKAEQEGIISGRKDRK